MENKPMTILLIEDDEFECQKFKSYVETIDNVKIIGTTNSSDEGLEYFKTYLPEAIVLDIELHKGQGSGIEFINNAKKFMTEFRPITVVTTNASSSILYDKLHEEGVDLIFYKKQIDYSPKLIVSSLLSLRKTLHKFNSENKNLGIPVETPAEHDTKISKRIDAELNLIGISSHLKGREYIHNAIMYLIKEKDNGEGETVFNHLANVYKKSSSSISRVMQTAINYAWRKSSPDDLEMYYTTKIDYNTGVPTPTELIYYYKDKILKDL